MTSVRGGGTSEAQPVSHSSSLAGVGNATDSDYYVIGLPTWKKDLLLRRKQQAAAAAATTISSESQPTDCSAPSPATPRRPTSLESAGETRPNGAIELPQPASSVIGGVEAMPSLHVALSRRPSGGGSGAATATEASQGAAVTPDDDLSYETGFVSKIRMRFSRLAASSSSSEEGGAGAATAAAAAAVAAARRFAHVEPPAYLATTTRVVGDPRSPTMTPSAAYLQRRRSSGARDMSEIVIVERSAAPTSLPTPQQQHPQQLLQLRQPQKQRAEAHPHLPSPGDDSGRTSAAATASAATARKAEPPAVRAAAAAGRPDATPIAASDLRSATAAAVTAAATAATALNGRQATPAASDVALRRAAAQHSSSGLSVSAASAGAAATGAAISGPVVSGRAAIATQGVPVRDLQLPKKIGPSSSDASASVAAAAAAATDAADVQAARVPTVPGEAAPPAAASPSDERNGEFFRPVLREVVPERGTGKRLLDTRTDSGFQRRIPDYERREGKAPLFLNANVVVGRGSFRKSAPPKAKIRPNVSFSDLTDTKVYPSEAELMTEMSRETGCAYYDDPAALNAATASSSASGLSSLSAEDDDSELRALTSTALSSRVAAASRSETLGSYRASLVGTYSFGQHMLKDQHNGDGWGQQQQPADGIGNDGHYYSTDIIVKPADGIGPDNEQASATFSANEASDLLF